MTEPRTTEPFETRFADRIQAYTDVATTRPIDALAVSRTAMSSQGATGWSLGRLGADLRDRRIAGVPWAAAGVVAVLVGVAAIALLGRASDRSIGMQPTPTAMSSSAPATGGPIPDTLTHSWERPYAVTPGLDKWGSGSLRLASGSLAIGSEAGAATSGSTASATGSDTITVKATDAILGCAIGDSGTYQWSLDGKDTILTLTAIGTDACAARETALAGDWVRSDLTPPDPRLPPGTYETSGFDPFGRPTLSGQLSYTVPAGWKVKDDQSGVFLLHHIPDASPVQPSDDTMVFALARPALAADFEKGASCGPVGEAPNVGHSVDDLVAAILARPGVVSTPPVPVTVGGYEGRLLDLRLAPSWTGGCLSPYGPIVSMPILVPSGTDINPVCAISPGSPLRLILLDLGDGRTASIGIFGLDPSGPGAFDEEVAAAMPVIESFEFHPPTP